MTNAFLLYLASLDGEGSVRLPPLNVLSDELGVSVSVLREQLEVAKAMGLVEVRPRTGIRRLPYTFSPAVIQSLSYALELNGDNFTYFADLRNQLEAAFWFEAVNLLTSKDIVELQLFLTRAWEKLLGTPVKIPHTEHRKLHLCIFSRLENPFVLGILEAFWAAYEAKGLNLYADYEYLHEVWKYHQKIVEAIADGDFNAGYNALVSHKDMLYHHPTGKVTEGSRKISV
jgi:DNA-binding FadR family transcriptional regulator